MTEPARVLRKLSLPSVLRSEDTWNVVGATCAAGLFQLFGPAWIPASGGLRSWAATGIALGAALTVGRLGLLGPLLGLLIASLIGNVDLAVSDPLAWWTTFGADALLLTTTTLLGVVLVRRLIGELLLLNDTLLVVSFLLLTGPISAGVSMAGLLLLGLALPLPLVSLQQATLYVSLSSFALIGLTPVWLSLFGRPRSAWGPRRLTVGLPLFVSTLVLTLLTARLLEADRTRVQHEVQLRTESFAARVEHRIRAITEVVRGLANFYVGSEEVTEREFATFARRSLIDHPEFAALDWFPRVRLEERERFEREMSQRIPGFLLHDRDGARRVPAGVRREYFPIVYVEPSEHHQALIGFDMASEPLRRAAIERTRRTLLPSASAPLRSVEKGEPILLLVAPITPSLSSPDQLQGFAAGILRVSSFWQALLLPTDRTSLHLSVSDFTDSYDEPSTFLLSDAGAKNRFVAHHSVVVDVAGRSWRVDSSATRALYEETGIISPEAISLSMTVLLGLFATFLLVMSGHANRVEYLVQLRTRQLETARQEAEHAARTKSEFLANMSHEIRTPMNGVLGMAQLLVETELTAEQKDYVQTILQSGRALLTVINEILDFSQLEAGKMQLVRAPFDPRALVKEILPLLAPRAEEKELELEVRFADDLPAGFVGDAGRIRQILLNLAGNAIKFTGRGWVRIEVARAPAPSSEAAPPDASRDFVRFSVIDSGPGITPADRERLFHAFAQLDSSTTRTHEGTGLGLAICKRMAELLGGDIHLESELGKGSHFWIQIPLEPLAALPPLLERPPSLHPVVSTGRVLIADDNAVNQRVARRLTESLGLEADVVSNGKEAVEAILSTPYDLVLMDCHMPLMDGFEATRIVCSQLGDRRPPIIALTASAMKEDVERCLEAGMVAHLAKPIAKNALRSMLHRHLNPSAEEQPEEASRSADDLEAPPQRHETPAESAASSEGERG